MMKLSRCNGLFLAWLFAMLVIAPGSAGAQKLYSYEGVLQGAGTTIPESTNCANFREVNFTVPQTFTNAVIAIGVDIQHNRRRDLRLSLVAPNVGATTRIFQSDNNSSANGNLNNFRATYYGIGTDADAAYDGSDDPPASTRDTAYRRLIRDQGGTNISNFYTGAVNGTWRLRVCDARTDNTGETNPTVASSAFVSARLFLLQPAATTAAVCKSRSTLDWAAFADGLQFLNTTLNDITVTRTALSGEAVGDAGGASQLSFRVNATANLIGNTTDYYRMAMDVDEAAQTTEIRSIEWVDFTFGQPVRGLEFSIGDVDWANAQFEDMARIEGFDAGGARVPYQQVLGSVHERAGDWVEGDADATPDSTVGNFRVHFDGPVTRVRLTYAQSDEPANAGQMAVGLLNMDFCAFDHGDAPSTFGTSGVSSARHVLANRDLFLGTAPPLGENVAAPNAAADGDHTGGETEDGASAVPTFSGTNYTCGAYVAPTGQYCRAITYTNNQTNPGQLVGWVDFNKNGVFDANERSLPNLAGTAFAGALDATFTTGNIQASSTGTVILLWTIPAGTPVNAATSYLRTRITTDPSFFTDASPSPTGTVRDGEIEDFTIGAGTLPVTLARFESTRIDSGTVRVDFTTATNMGTMGYRVLQSTSDGKLFEVTDSLLLTDDLTSTRPKDYVTVVATTSNAPLYLEEVSITGRSERFGPYRLGESMGSRPSLLAPPWEQAALELNSSLRPDNQRRLERAANGGPSAEILVDRSGLQHVRYEDLVAVGLDWSGATADQFRLQHADESSGVRIVGGTTFGPGRSLEFLARNVEGSQYTRVRPYLLSRVASGSPLGQAQAAPESGLDARYWVDTTAVDADRFYSESSPLNDPWYYDTVARNNTATAGKQWTLQLASPRVGDDAELSLRLWGDSVWPETTPDHVFRVLFNGVEVGRGEFDGIAGFEQQYPLPAALVVPGANIVRIELLQTGETLDRIRVDSIAVRYVKPITARDGQLVFNAHQALRAREFISASSFEETEPDPNGIACGSGCRQLRAEGFASNDIVAYQSTPTGWVELVGGIVSPSGTAGEWSIRLKPVLEQSPESASDSMSGKLVIADRTQAHRPTIRPAPSFIHPLTGGPADLVILTSSRFASQLGPLVAARIAEGLTVSVVETSQVFEHYSAGIVDPMAIKAFIAEAYGQKSTRYVLIIGGDTYDYFNRLGVGSISDVPTLYRATNPYTAFAPVDAAFADVDDDGLPDLAIGRLPARTSAELAAMLGKSLQVPAAGNRRGLFVTERSSPAQNFSYSDEMDGLIALSPPGWQAAATRIFLDDYAAGSAGVAMARTDFANQVNAGKDWVAFYGHASPSIWTNDNLLEAAQLSSLLTNAVVQPVVTEFGCWGGYFVEPTYDTMGHAWTGGVGHGARAMLASSSLTEKTSDIAFARLLFTELTVPGVRVGDALLEAKRTLHGTAPEMQEVILGMTLLGDPTLRMGN